MMDVPEVHETDKINLKMVSRNQKNKLIKFSQEATPSY
jgi:hypothetical protein